MKEIIENIQQFNPNDRELYLYNDIEEYEVLELVCRINLLNKYDDNFENEYYASRTQFLEENFDFNEEDMLIKPYDREPIILHISCYGGIYESGISLINTIKSSRTPIVGIVDSNCYSMAVPVLLYCDYKLGYTSSRVMIHDVSTVMDGKGRHIERKLEDMKQQRNAYMKMITDKCQISAEEIENILEKNMDWYLDAEDCELYGIFDEIIDKEHNCEECDEEYETDADMVDGNGNEYTDIERA